MTSRWVRDVNSLYDFIGYVVLSAPDRFPREDYLSDHEQMTLEKAFEELRQGVLLVEKDFPGADEERGLTRVLDEALALYRGGDESPGAHRLQDFQNLVFKALSNRDA